MSKRSVLFSTLLGASLFLTACVEGPTTTNGIDTPTAAAGSGINFERDIAFATRSCFQALQSKARGIAIDPRSGFLPAPIEKFSFRNNTRANPSVYIRYTPSRLRSTDNRCTVRTVGGKHSSHTQTVEKTVAALGFQSRLVPGYGGKLYKQYVKGSTIIQTFRSRTSASYGAGLNFKFVAEH